MTIPLPAPVRTLIALLETAGYVTYAVGGCVRDALRGAAPHDWDLATAAPPEEMKRALAGIRLLETGMAHGTLTALTGGMAVEITTFRRDGTYSDHRRPDGVSFTGALAEDLGRRDFTINAMAYHPDRGLTDPYEGAADLRAGRIRCVGDPARRFEEDALRIFRALRFAAVLEFSIEAETAEALRRQRTLLSCIAAERMQAELMKLLCGPGARRVLETEREIIFTALPQLRPMDRFDQHNAYHHLPLWEHSCACVAAVPPEPDLRLAALLHDCGKPQSLFRDASGVGHFYGHPERGADLAREICHALRCSNERKHHVTALVRHHEQRLLDRQLEGNLRDVSLRRLLAKLGPDWLLDLLDLTRADALAQAPAFAGRLAAYEPLRRRVLDLIAAQPCLRVADLAVGGQEMMALGLAGPGIGKMLRQLLEEVIDGRLENEKEALMARARTHCGKAEP
ncbi:MAG: HD domain-containing protein [Oscillospiraceae bacterium]|jgi:tRNA nucleotidyltransferase (CCA-adding enzyme)|nr:HD domain-containing protein [Oscillospiraceae bacterium]